MRSAAADKVDVKPLTDLELEEAKLTLIDRPYTTPVLVRRLLATVDALQEKYLSLQYATGKMGNDCVILDPRCPHCGGPLIEWEDTLSEKT